MRQPAGLVLALLWGAVPDIAFSSSLSVWPQPDELSSGSQRLLISPTFAFKDASAVTTSILASAFERYTKVTFPRGAGEVITATADVLLEALEVYVQEPDDQAVPQLGMDESYSLEVPASGVGTLKAATVWGALRGLESFSQLVGFDFASGQYFLHGAPCSITDAPRFSHRGLLLDTSRHYLPLSAIRRTLEAMSYAKLNVLHWHIVDAQSFPLQSLGHPSLWVSAYSPDERYLQRDVAAVVEHARKRGIRVVLELDTPGHAYSWCQGVPEVCPDPACIQATKNINNIGAASGRMTGMRISVESSEPDQMLCRQPSTPQRMRPTTFWRSSGES
jgi:hexosaminidase